MALGFDIEGGLNGAATGVLFAVVCIIIFYNLRHTFLVPAAPPPTTVLAEPCRVGLEAEMRNCGCECADSLPADRAGDEKVYLVFTVTRSWSVRDGRWYLPRWAWTTHWAMEVRGIYYELKRWKGNGSVRPPGGFEMRSRPVTSPIEENKYRILMGYTHFQDSDIKDIGSKHAQNYAWDPFINNCQGFLHQAYFGKGLFSPLFKQQEIRCRQHGALRAIPNIASFGIMILMAFLYFLDSWLEWYLGLELSPGVLIMRSLPIVIGLIALFPRTVSYMRLQFRKWEVDVVLTRVWEESGDWFVSQVGRVRDVLTTRSNGGIRLP